MPFDLPLAKTDLAPVGVALIEKLAAAVGVFGKPMGTWLQALADAESEKIHAVGQVAPEAAALRRRATERLAFEQLRNQQNLEAVFGKTFAMLEPGIDPQNVDRLDNDWLAMHSERARLYSDEDMQTLFARILAEEVKQPGFFPRRTLQILSSLEKEEAMQFSSVCCFAVSDKIGPTPAIFRDDSVGVLPPIYAANGVHWEGLYNLTSIGLLKYTTPLLTDNIRHWGSSTIDVTYFGESRTYRLPPLQPGKSNSNLHYIHYGHVEFTDIGRRLFRIAGAKPIPSFFNYLEFEWLKRKVIHEGIPQN